MTKGADTKKNILGQALELSSELGLEGLTIGVLAKRVGMSKSGLYAHFDSKEELQCRVLDTAAEKFIDLVLAPALKESRGLQRLRTLFDLWLNWVGQGFSGGCPFFSASSDFDDREGPVRNHLLDHLSDVMGSIRRVAKSCVEQNEFRQDIDLEQFTFEFWGILLTYHHYIRLLNKAKAQSMAHHAFERLCSWASH